MRKVSHYVSTITGRIKTSFSRFGLTYFLSFLTMIWSILLLEEFLPPLLPDSSENFSLGMSIFFTLLFAMPVSAAAQLLAERTIPHFLFKFVLTCSAVCGYIFLFEVPWFGTDFHIAYQDVLEFRIVLILTAYLLFACIPYFFLREGLGRYLLRLSASFLATMALSFILLISVFSVAFTCEHLFGMMIPYNFAPIAFSVIAFGFSVIHFLSGVPRIEQDTETVPVIYRSILIYIMLPLLTIYTVLLYFYFTFQFASSAILTSSISSIVLWYSAVSVLTIFFLKELRADGNKALLLARSYLPYYNLLSLLPLFILIFSIYIRVEAYGLTVHRVYLILFTLTIMLSQFLLFFRHSFFRNIIPFLLSIFLIFSAVGPISAYEIAKADQLNRLYNMFRSAGIIRSGEVISNFKNMKLDDSSAALISKQATYVEKHFGLPPYITGNKAFSDFIGNLSAQYDKTVPAKQFVYRYYPSSMNNAVRFDDEVFVQGVHFFDDSADTLIDGYSGMFAYRSRILSILKDGETVGKINLQDAIRTFIRNNESDLKQPNPSGELKHPLVSYDFDAFRVDIRITRLNSVDKSDPQSEFEFDYRFKLK